MSKKLLFISFWTLIFVVSSFAQELYINEFLASNDSCYADPHGDFDDWIEIYNAGTEAVDIGGMYFTDDLTDLTNSMIPTTYPDSTTIYPGEFLIVWADKEPEQGILHLDDVKLSSGGEDIGLTAADGTTIIDSYTFGEQTTDVSEGRLPDGGATWEFFTVPTPGTSNVSVFSDDHTFSAAANISLLGNYPNPFNPNTNIRFAIDYNSHIKLVIYNTKGQIVRTLADENVLGEIFYEYNWNGMDDNGKKVSSGIYMYKLVTAQETFCRKMILLK